MGNRYVLRPFDGVYWDPIYTLTDVPALAGPLDAACPGNREPLCAEMVRRHYSVSDDEDGALVGYGAIEQQHDPADYRQFITLASPELWASVGHMLDERLMADLRCLGARRVWMREPADDRRLLDFARARGFQDVALVQARADGQPCRYVRLERLLT